ncbi:hypothetical protein CLI69_09815 [Prevotella intermedia]|nr:hypothetical protein CLI69_09815 [Prevotella intermedia]
MEYFSFIHYKPKYSERLGKRKKQVNGKRFGRWRAQQFKTTITSKKLAEIVFHTKYFSNFVSILIAVMGCKS